MTVKRSDRSHPKSFITDWWWNRANIWLCFQSAAVKTCEVAGSVMWVANNQWTLLNYTANDVFRQWLIKRAQHSSRCKNSLSGTATSIGCCPRIFTRWEKLLVSRSDVRVANHCQAIIQTVALPDGWAHVNWESLHTHTHKDKSRQEAHRNNKSITCQPTQRWEQHNED